MHNILYLSCMFAFVFCFVFFSFCVLLHAKALRIAVEVLGQRIAVYPVKSLQLTATDKKGRGPFIECLLVKKGTTSAIL